MRNQNAKYMALGGLMAALAVVIMSLGGMIPIATYVCCVLCMILCGVVLRFCGKRNALVWYVAVSILGLLLGTDKEAAALFAFIGYYPVLKPFFERKKVLGSICKIVFFNAVILTAYFLLIHLFGMSALMAEFSEMGIVGGVIMLVLGNATFLLFDRLLTKMNRKR